LVDQTNIQRRQTHEVRKRTHLSASQPKAVTSGASRGLSDPGLHPVQVQLCRVLSPLVAFGGTLADVRILGARPCLPQSLCVARHMASPQLAPTLLGLSSTISSSSLLLARTGAVEGLNTGPPVVACSLPSRCALHGHNYNSGPRFLFSHQAWRT
jgi:hypothetical protein